MALEHRTVRKSNALVEASYRLSVFEQRIILSCITQLKRGETITDEVMYRVSASEIAEAAGITPQTAYEHLKAASARLFERRVTLYKTPEGTGKTKVLHTRWIQSCVYQQSEGCVEVRFGRDILPYLTELSAQFTKYKFGDVARMSSSHAIRLYELLVQWDYVGKREIEIDWLRAAFQLEGKYTSIKDFKRWVIEPAVEQVNKHSPISVEWDQKKTGRKVSHFIFRFHPKKNTKSLPKQNKQPAAKGWYGIPASVLLKNAREGESLEDCALRLLEERKRLANAES